MPPVFPLGEVETLPADKYSDYEYNDYEEPAKVTKSEELAPPVPGKGQPWSFKQNLVLTLSYEGLN